MDITLERATDGTPGTLLIGAPARPRRTRGSHEEAHDQLAASNDELQSANEELAATNEELQATNEELASLNEEFQSTNQTLASTNVELGAVAKSTRAATDLMIEFLQSWKEAIVACDATQRITLYNRKAADLFALDPSCLGRPLTAIFGNSEHEVDAWFERAREAPVNATFEHKDGALALHVEHVRAAAGTPLGWVLSWAPTSTPTS